MLAALQQAQGDFEDEAAALGIDQGMTLAAVDLFAGVIAARSAGFGGLDALAVDDCGAGPFDKLRTLRGRPARDQP